MLQIGVTYIFAQGPYDPEQSGYTTNFDMFVGIVFIFGVLLFIYLGGRYEDQKWGSPNTTSSSPKGERKSRAAASASKDRKGNPKAKTVVKTAPRPAAKSGPKRAFETPKKTASLKPQDIRSLTPEQRAKRRENAAKRQAQANYLAELKKRATETPTKTVSVKPQDIKRLTPEQQARHRANAAKQQAREEYLAELKKRAKS